MDNTIENSVEYNTVLSSYCTGQTSTDATISSNGVINQLDVNGFAPMLENFISNQNPDYYKFDSDLAFAGPGVFKSDCRRYGIVDPEYVTSDILLTVTFETSGSWLLGWYELDLDVDGYTYTNAHKVVRNICTNSEPDDLVVRVMKLPKPENKKIIVPAYSDSPLMVQGGTGIRNFKVIASYNSDVDAKKIL